MLQKSFHELISFLFDSISSYAERFAKFLYRTIIGEVSCRHAATCGFKLLRLNVFVLPSDIERIECGKETHLE